MTLNFYPSIRVRDRHFVGLHIGFQGCDIRYEKIEEAFYNNAQHQDLKDMTSGYDNIYQLGISYRFTHIFKNGFTITPSFNTGTLWVAKEGHYLTYYPNSSDLSESLRFGTYPADNHLNFGGYFSTTLSAGYYWKNSGFMLFGGARFFYGEAEQKNQYVEEWTNSGTFTSEEYFEQRSLKTLSFEIGVMLQGFYSR
ncbi:MAG: hypothetical protein ABJG68_03060 [Crocinitomicaceae bacterium]